MSAGDANLSKRGKTALLLAGVLCVALAPLLALWQAPPSDRTPIWPDGAFGRFCQQRLARYVLEANLRDAPTPYGLLGTAAALRDSKDFASSYETLREGALQRNIPEAALALANDSLEGLYGKPNAGRAAFWAEKALALAEKKGDLRTAAKAKDALKLAREAKHAAK